MKRSYVFFIRISLIAVITLIILGYGLFQARNFLRGPKISIASPQNGIDSATPIVLVSGLASNITHISMDDRPIFVDKLGNFSEKLLLRPGYNIIKLRAQDKFGRVIEKLVELNYTPIEKISIASSTMVFIQ